MLRNATEDLMPDPDVERLDLQNMRLWTTNVVIVQLLALGVVVLQASQLPWPPDLHSSEQAASVQLMVGFLALLVTLDAYLLAQRTRLRQLIQLLGREREARSLAEQSSMTDPLTGLYNRRAIEHLVEKEKLRTDRHGEPFSVIVLDLDDFKQLNTRLGHAGGDRALVQVAQLLNQTVRRSDYVCRLGGDEFAIVLPHTDARQARRVEQLLSEAAERWNAEHGNSAFLISFSSGCAEYRGGDVAQVFDKADRDMYRAKESRQGAGVVLIAASKRAPGPLESCTS